MVFFFKQKTAYEMRISDWSSDVCSSDLRRPCARPRMTRREAANGTIAAGQPVQAGDRAPVSGLRNARAGGWLTRELRFCPGLMAHVRLRTDPINSTGFYSPLP